MSSSAFSFNTQPPEGGWWKFWIQSANVMRFNTQPPEGGWRLYGDKLFRCCVSTHSRLKAAGFNSTVAHPIRACCVSTHSRLKAAGSEWCATALRLPVSTHSRLKAAGKICDILNNENPVSTHSRLKAAGLAQYI